ncbi:MAG TPA: phage Gp37/Gp68 family protein [Blastocatellia bacterium]|nr:phage Gp37/Gp68 family protein [Blastocatellia bacterium]
MSESSKIEWTDATWNPVRGCTPISPGCTHCYAKTFAERFRGVAGHAYEQGFDLRLVPENVRQPLTWLRPRKIFVNSMSDLFHEEVPFHFIRQIFHVMQHTERHTYQILTKRAERMRQFCKGHANRFQPWPLPNVWLGVSVEDRKYGLPRIEHLREIDAAVRFLSIEPLLEDLGEIDLTGIHWVIVGGESGPGARGMQADWVRSIRQQCQAAKIPFFFKQWGGPKKRFTGRLLDGRTWDEMPERKERACA